MTPDKFYCDQRQRNFTATKFYDKIGYNSAYITGCAVAQALC